jgi:hypothetical protein
MAETPERLSASSALSRWRWRGTVVWIRRVPGRMHCKSWDIPCMRDLRHSSAGRHQSVSKPKLSANYPGTDIAQPKVSTFFLRFDRLPLYFLHFLRSPVCQPCWSPSAPMHPYTLPRPNDSVYLHSVPGRTMYSPSQRDVVERQTSQVGDVW